MDELLYNDAIRRTGKKKDAVINEKNIATKNRVLLIHLANTQNN